MIRKIIIKAFLFIFLASFTTLACAEDFYWLQLMPNNELWFRRIEKDKEKCQEVYVDGIRQTPEIHAQKNSSFPLSCKVVFSASNPPKKISFGEKNINIDFDIKNIKKLAIIGDTGCRVHKFFKQDCKKDWHFAKISDSAMLHKPDVIVHLGDYIYREDGYQDSWQTWYQDFFSPAKNLLTSGIPWVMVRGNHEDCKRNGNGWFAMLSAQNSECINYQEPYNIDINSFQLLITDSTLEEMLISDLNKIAPDANHKKTWLLTHRPLIYLDKNGNITGYKKAFNQLPQKINTIISGHIHAMQYIHHSNKTQIVAGNSGTSLSFHATAENGKNSRMFYGFAIIDLLDDGYKMTGYDQNNKEALNTVNFKNQRSLRY